MMATITPDAIIILAAFNIVVSSTKRSHDPPSTRLHIPTASTATPKI